VPYQRTSPRGYQRVGFARDLRQGDRLFSDAGSAFVAEWGIVDGISVRSVLTGSSDVVNLFGDNIDPPEFD